MCFGGACLGQGNCVPWQYLTGMQRKVSGPCPLRQDFIKVFVLVRLRCDTNIVPASSCH